MEKRKHATYQQKKQVEEYLKAYLTQHGNYWLYTNNMTDEKIGQLLDPPVSVGSVKGVRMECFGLLNSGHGGGNTLSTRVKKLEKRDDEVRDSFNKLLRALKARGLQQLEDLYFEERKEGIEKIDEGETSG